MPPKTKLALVFDDGFLPSTLKTAEIFERFNLRATFAVLADPAGFAPDHPVGDFPLWNDLRRRGHTIHPHGLHHTNLTTVPFQQATSEIARCLSLFTEKLDGFDPKNAIWHYAYNSDTPALNAHLLHHVRATRGAGNGLLSPHDLASRTLHSRTFGPADPTTDLLAHLDTCRQLHPPASIYSLHGLDGQAWGAIPSPSLERLLDTLLTDPAFEYWPL